MRTEEENNKKILIYFDRKSGEYHHFETAIRVPLDKLEECVKGYNESDMHTTSIKIYTDELIVNLCRDVHKSYRIKEIVEALEGLENSMGEFEYELREFKNSLNEQKEGNP